MVPKLDVRRCNAEKKYAGDLSFSFAGDDSLIGIPFVSFSSEVEATLHYEILEDDSVEVTGHIAFTLKGACSRCLKETERRITGEAEGYFEPDGEGNEDYSYRNGVVDFAEFLRDSVAFLMPMRLECGEACVPPPYKQD